MKNLAEMENNENSAFRQYLSFEKHIRKGNWDAANQFLSSHPSEAVCEKTSPWSSKALHIAVFAGHTHIVEELVKIMSEENLKIKDEERYTVLGNCALVGNIQMVKCIIGKSQALLSIGNGCEEFIPVVVALTYNSNRIDIARYLYSETPQEDLMPGKSINGATFITRAMYSKAFGKNLKFKYILSLSCLYFETRARIPFQLIAYVFNSIDLALDLLQRYPKLAIALDAFGMSPVDALARLSFAYPSGNRLIFWKQFIYDSEYHNLS